jgi:transcriptional regulator with XRE-family HTH domain
MTDKTISPVIRHLTAAERFGTQTRLAEAAGVRPHTISGKATGKNPLTYVQMQRVLRVGPEMGVDVAPEDFFPEDSDETQGAAA